MAPPVAVTEPEHSELTVPTKAMPNGGEANGYSNGFSRTTEMTMGYRSQKTSILRERTMRTTTTIQTRLGSSSGMLLDNISSFEDFLDAVALQRLRYMPHDGSKWDKVLRAAEGFASYVYLFHDSVHGFMLHSEEATRMIWSSILSLLQMGPQQIVILQKAFSVFHRLGLSISLFLRQQSLLTATAEIRRELSHAYADLMELTCDVSAHYLTKTQGKSLVGCEDFDDHFNGLISAFGSHTDRALCGLWMTHMEGFFGDESFEIDDVRAFLEQSDYPVRRILASRDSHGLARAEFTCEWFAPHLENFVRRRNRMLLVTGAAGCGKTVLSDWIVEELQGSMDQDPYDAIFYRVERDIPSTATSLSLVKGLLLQTLDRYIGHEHLLSHVRKAIKMSTHGSSAAEVEETLWQALRHVAHHSKLMVVIDGLDQLEGEHSAQKVLDRLHDLTVYERHAGCKVIVLSRPRQKAAPSETQHFSISEANSAEDIRHFIGAKLDASHQFMAMSDKEKKALAHKISEKANASFLWAEFAYDCLKHENTYSGFMEFLDRAPRNVEAFFDHHVSELDFKSSETKAILSWILAAERPLSLQEIKLLLEIDTKQCSHSHRYGSITEIVKQTVGPLVAIQDGFVFLQHSSMRKHLITCKTDEFHFDLRRAQSSLVLLCLAYVKLHVHDDVDLVTQPWTRHDYVSYFNRFKLLEYCTRYWSAHFKSSRFYKSSDDFEIDVRLRSCMPSSSLLAVLEGACSWGYVVKEMELYHHISYRLRRLVLGEHSAACLQSLIFMVQITESIKSSLFIELSYEAWKISRTMADITIILATAEAFIRATTSITITKRTEIVIRKEEVLKYIIATYKRTHGISHELTIRYTKTLAELYIAIKETHLAVELYRELYEVSIERYGYFHKETTTIYEVLISQLKIIEKYDVLLEITRAYHEYVCKHLEVHDERRVKSTMILVQMYEERKQVTKAEEVLVSFWKSITTSSTTVETKIDIAIEYSRFLCRHSRKEEATTVMRGVWEEVQTYEYSETLTKRLKVVAEEFKSLKVLSVARSIFKSLWQYSKKVEKSSFSEEIATSLAETVTEMIETSEETTTTTTTIEEETTLKEIFESTVSSSSTVTSKTMKISVALASSYMKQEKWSEAIEVYSKTLSKTWSSVESVEIVESEYSEEVIEVAFRLAECRFKLLQIEKAEIIYRNIFRALLRSRCSHSFLVRTAKIIIEFHEKTYRFEKAISIYQELFAHLQIKLGKSHHSTIEILMAYGALARRLGRRQDAIQAYYQIYLAFLITEDGCCQYDGVDAAFILCELYEEELLWDEARTIYACLWKTFVNYGKKFKLGVSFVDRVYERYMFILEKKVKVEFSVIHQLAVEYRQTCISFYGEHHEITLKATMHLAEICERSETHRKESMSLYEHVLKNSKTTTTTTTTREVRKKLAQMYSHSETTVSKSVSLYQEQYESVRQEYGYSSTESLTVMKELVMTYKKTNTQEMRIKATQTLKTAITEIFQHEVRSERLIESAKFIARTYVECGFKEEATLLIQELRQTVIEEVRTSTKTERTSYAFFAAFAEIIMGSSFSTIIAEVRSEVILYEAYFQVIKTTHIHTIMERGCRLRMFLLEAGRTEEVKKIEEEMFSVFIKTIIVSQNVEQHIIRKLFNICVEYSVEEHSEVTIVQRSVETVFEFCNTSHFHHAYDMALLVHKYLHSVGGFTSHHHVHSGFRLALYLTGRRTKHAHDEKLYKSMLELSKIILREALEASITLEMSFTELTVSELNEIVVLLGEQENFEDLERILNNLWSSRIVQKTWSYAIVVSIGRRLIETRFSRGHYDAAIHLCQDIRYNLTRVWGTLDPITLEFTLLLSSLYTARQQHKKAMALHEDVLSHLAYNEDSELEQCEYPGHAAAEQMEYLRRSYQRLGNWDKEASNYKQIFGDVSKRFAKEKGWTEKQVSHIDKWSTKGNASDLQIGVWTKPQTFGFMTDVKADSKKSVLRRTSNNVAAMQKRFGTRVH